MYKFIIKCFLCSSIFFLLAGCTSTTTQKSKDSHLTIATIGSPPEITDQQITFESISLQNLQNDTKQLSEKYDALFIMPKYLSDAANDVYIASYEKLRIPTFFIESKKQELPFINDDVSYENAPQIDEVEYFATGYLNQPNEETDVSYMTWRYLQTSKSSAKALENVYKKIFQTIEDLKMSSR